MAEEEEAPVLLAKDLVPLFVEKIEAGKSLKVAAQELAAEYSVSAAAIKKAYYRSEKSEGNHGNCLLSEHQEKIVLAVVISFSERNLGLTNSKIILLIRDLYGITVSNTWVFNFIQRHSDQVSKRHTKLLADKRMSSDTLENVQCFVDELQSYLETHHFPPDCILNCDETRVAYQAGGSSSFRVESTSKQKANLLGTRQDNIVTLLVFISAAGKVELSIYIFKNSFGESDENDATFVLYEHERIMRGDWPRYYAFTDSGYINSILWDAAMALFEDHWTTRNPGRNCLLLCDQLGAHARPLTVARALNKGVHHFFLPSNTSHFTQPLDDCPFASFKTALARIHSADVQAAELRGESRGSRLVSCSYQAENEAFTVANNKNAFEKVGLWPFDPDKIMQRARANLGGDVDNDRPEQLDEFVKAFKVVMDASNPKPIVKHTASVKKDVIHSPQSLLALAQKKQESDEAKQQEKVARLEAKVAKVIPKLGVYCRKCH